MVATLNQQTVHLAPSRWWNVQGIFAQPSSAFQRLAQRPTWLLPLSLMILIKQLRVYLLFSPNKTPTALLLTFLMDAVPTLIEVLMCSGIFLLALFMSGAETSFKKIFSVLAHTFFVYTLITVVLSAIVMTIAPDKTAIDLQNPVMSNLSFLVNRNAHLALHHFVSMLDVIIFYHLFLIALGLSIVSRKLSLKAATMTVVAVYGLYVVITVGIKFMVS